MSCGPPKAHSTWIAIRANSLSAAGGSTLSPFTRRRLAFSTTARLPVTWPDTRASPSPAIASTIINHLVAPSGDRISREEHAAPFRWHHLLDDKGQRQCRILP